MGRQESMTERRNAGAGGAALYRLMDETIRSFFRLRAVGKRLGAVAPWGGGVWGLLRSLGAEGPQTVPAIARSRPVARQRVQRLADEAMAAGLVEPVDNPAHRRSKLLRLTPKGEAELAALEERIRGECERLAEGLDPRALAAAAGVLEILGERLAAAALRPSAPDPLPPPGRSGRRSAGRGSRSRPGTGRGQGRTPPATGR